MSIELNELTFKLLTEREIGEINIKKYYHPDLFLRLWRKKDVRAFAYNRGGVLYIKINVGAGGAGKSGVASPGQVIYNSAEDALGIITKNKELSSEEIIVGTFSGDIDKIRSINRRLIILKRQ